MHHTVPQNEVALGARRLLCRTNDFLELKLTAASVVDLDRVVCGVCERHLGSSEKGARST